MYSGFSNLDEVCTFIKKLEREGYSKFVINQQGNGWVVSAQV